MHPPAVVRRLRDATLKADTFLIADEVFTGYGRTGKMWAVDHAGVTPDLLCLGKGFTAGMVPMAATMATARVYDGFRGGEGRALMHGHTFCGYPVGAAVAREVLAIYREERVLEGIAPRARRIQRFFEEEIAPLHGVRRVRCLGMVGAADLGDSGYRGARGPEVAEAARRLGAYLRPLGDTVYVAPPLDVDVDVLDELLGIVAEAIRATA
jgi:adenosylmethionine-8-amino-7-oxononanoate aminotransferase